MGVRVRGAAVIVACLAVAACSPGSSGSTAPGSTPSAPGTTPPPSALAAGLLPAAAFGSGYTASALDSAQVASFDPISSLQGYTVMPPECQAVVGSLSPFVRATDLAAQAVVGTDPAAANYAEVIASGLTAMGLDLPGLRILLGSCRSVSLRGGDGVQIDTTYEQTDVGTLGDDRVSLHTTANIVSNGQTQQVVGDNLLVVDGDRVLALVALGQTAAAVDTGFAQLATVAFSTQHGALG